MENITRRGFMGAMGAMGAFAAAGLTASQAQADITFHPESVYAPVSDEMPTEYTNEQLDAMVRDQTMVTEDYTFPSGKTIPAVYINLRNKINRIGVGVGSDVEGNERAWDFIMLLFTEDDAEHYLEMPVYQQFTARDYSFLSGRPIEECEEVLESMAERALIIKRVRSGQTFYELMTAEFGFWEWAIERWDEPGYVEGHEVLYGNDPTSIPEPYLITMPCSEDIVKGKMVPYTSWEDMIRSQTVMCTTPCACRTAGMKRGDRSEENIKRFNVDTCWIAGDIAQMMIDRGIGHELTVEEAIANVKANVEAGTVCHGIWAKDQMLMCQCDNEQCVELNAIKAAAGTGLQMPYVSLYNLVYNKDACLKCYACVDRCPMEAITTDADGYLEMNQLCIKCGQCAYICPAEARWLTPIEEADWRMPEDDYIAKRRRQARLRMAGGFIHDFLGQESVDAAIAAGRITEDEVGHAPDFDGVFETARLAAEGPTFGGLDPVSAEAQLKAELGA